MRYRAACWCHAEADAVEKAMCCWLRNKLDSVTISMTLLFTIVTHTRVGGGVMNTCRHHGADSSQ